MSGPHRHRTLVAPVLTLLCAALITTAAHAQDESAYPTLGIGGNVGFQKLSSSNGLLELGVDMPLYLNEHLSLGPWMQLGLSQDVVNLIFTGNVRWHFDFMERTRFHRVRPFVQGGLGLVYTKFEGSKQTDFTMNMGFGAEVPVTEHVYLGSDFMFSPILTRPAGGNWAFSWQFLTLRYRF